MRIPLWRRKERDEELEYDVQTMEEVIARRHGCVVANAGCAAGLLGAGAQGDEGRSTGRITMRVTENPYSRRGANYKEHEASRLTSEAL